MFSKLAVLISINAVFGCLTRILLSRRAKISWIHSRAWLPNLMGTFIIALLCGWERELQSERKEAIEREKEAKTSTRSAAAQTSKVKSLAITLDRNLRDVNVRDSGADKCTDNEVVDENDSDASEILNHNGVAAKTEIGESSGNTRRRSRSPTNDCPDEKEPSPVKHGTVTPSDVQIFDSGAGGIPSSRDSDIEKDVNTEDKVLRKDNRNRTATDTVNRHAIIDIYIPAIKTGFCGSLTTFSTWHYDVAHGTKLNSDDTRVLLLEVLFLTWIVILLLCFGIFYICFNFVGSKTVSIVPSIFTPKTKVYRITTAVLMFVGLMVGAALTDSKIYPTNRNPGADENWNKTNALASVALFSSALIAAPLGALTRWKLSAWIGEQFGKDVGTFLCNFLACALLTVMNVCTDDSNWLKIIGTGFCGCWSTVSTFVADCFIVCETKTRAAIYLILSPSVGFGVCYLLLMV